MKQFDVALSFSGADRQLVEPVAKHLLESNLRVFYDRYHQDELWGQNLSDKLENIYAEDCSYCVMFISKNYIANDSTYTRDERRTIAKRALSQKAAYLLPVRLDDSNIPGLPEDIAFITMQNTTPNELAKMIVKKVGGGVRLKDDGARTIVELESNGTFTAFNDVEMHRLHQAVMEALRERKCSVVGCCVSPHILQLSVTHSARKDLQKKFTSGYLSKATHTEWTRMKIRKKLLKRCRSRFHWLRNKGLYLEETLCAMPR